MMIENNKKLTIALAQAALPPGSSEENFQKGEDMVRKAGKKGADLVLLPELWTSGFDLKNSRRYASEINQGMFQRMAHLAADSQIYLGGSLIESDQGNYFNTFVLYDNIGRLISSYRKIHLFELLNEKKYLKAGSELIIVDTLWGKIGLAVCYDLRFPELFRSYAVLDVDLILIVAEWPQRRIAHWNQLLIARAIENQYFIAGVNKVGDSRGEKLGGGSTVVNPMGEVLTQGGDEEGLLYANLDLSEVQKIRRWMPVLDDRKPEVYLKSLYE